MRKEGVICEGRWPSSHKEVVESADCFAKSRYANARLITRATACAWSGLASASYPPQRTTTSQRWSSATAESKITHGPEPAEANL